MDATILFVTSIDQLILSIVCILHGFMAREYANLKCSNKAYTRNLFL